MPSMGGCRGTTFWDEWGRVLEESPATGRLQLACWDVLSRKWILSLLAITDQRAEWRLTSATPVYAMETVNDSLEQPAISELVEAIEELEIVDKKLEAVVGRCGIQ